MKMTYLVVGPGLWAVDDDLKFALSHLMSMSGLVGRDKDKCSVDVFHVSEDWEHDGFSVRATKVIKLPAVLISRKLADKVYAAISAVEDLADETLIAHDRATGEVAS